MASFSDGCHVEQGVVDLGPMPLPARWTDSAGVQYFNLASWDDAKLNEHNWYEAVVNPAAGFDPAIHTLTDEYVYDIQPTQVFCTQQYELQPEQQRQDQLNENKQIAVNGFWDEFNQLSANIQANDDQSIPADPNESRKARGRHQAQDKKRRNKAQQGKNLTSKEEAAAEWEELFADWQDDAMDAIDIAEDQVKDHEDTMDPTYPLTVTVDWPVWTPPA